VGRPFVLTEAQQQEATRLCAGGWSLSKCAELFGCAASTIMLVLVRAGIPRRDRVKRCFVNGDYFAKIDTEDKAYWLGFLTADGYVKPGCVALALQLRDAAHIAAYAAAVESTYAIWRNASACGTTICSELFSEHLGRLGLDRNKSTTATPIAVPAELCRHYWRGLVDGDGCVWNYKVPGVRLCGTHAIVQGFADAVEAVLGIVPRKVRPQASIWTTTYQGRSAQEVIAWLYSGARVSLRRKARRADEAVMARLSEVLC